VCSHVKVGSQAGFCIVSAGPASRPCSGVRAVPALPGKAEFYPYWPGMRQSASRRMRVMARAAGAAAPAPSPRMRYLSQTTARSNWGIDHRLCDSAGNVDRLVW